MENLLEEILRDIFLIATKNAVDDNPISYLTPLRISHVCSRWRNIALSFGEIWSYLYTDRTQYYRYGGRAMEIFDTWLRRTNGQPLNFTLIFYRIRGDQRWTSMIEHMVSTMVAEQHRWRKVHIMWDLFSSLNTVATNMPLLESLDLSYTGRVRLDAPAIIDLSASRNVQKLILFGPHELRTGSAPLNAEVGSLETLSVDIVSSGPQMREWWNLLRNAKNIKRLRISFPHSSPISQDTAIAEDLEMVVLPRVRTLALGAGNALNSALDSLTLPSLHALSCDCLGPPEIDNLSNFLRRSMPPLTAFYMRSFGKTEGDLISTLRLMPTLESLQIISLYAPVALFQELTVPDPDSTNEENKIKRGGTLCPALRRFLFGRVCAEDTTEAVINAFSTMLMSRQQRMKTFMVVELNGQVEMLQLPLTKGHPDYEKVRQTIDWLPILLISDGASRYPSDFPLLGPAMIS